MDWIDYDANGQTTVALNMVTTHGEWYPSRHPDVKEAIARGRCADAQDHYARHGFYEHRMPFLIKVDEDLYLSEYVDIRSAVRSGAYETGHAHFEALDDREARFPVSHFTLYNRNDRA
jgi:hypothetical protein